MPTAKSQAGVMLIEALVAILIFSIGILALLGMQGTAIKSTTDARYRSEASFLATQIVGQMWVDDKDPVKLARYDTDNPADYIHRDTWVANVAEKLPGALPPSIKVGPGGPFGLTDNEVRVQVQWKQPGETETRQVIMLNRIHAGT